MIYKCIQSDCGFAVVRVHSGPCMTVVVTHGDTGEGVVEQVRELMGPADVDLAKQDAPDRYVF